MCAMQPKTREWLFAGRGFGLRDLVVVMYGDVLDSACMDIDLGAEGRAYHCGAFDVPAGEAFTPRAVPTDLS